MHGPLDHIRHRWRILAAALGGAVAGWGASHLRLPGSGLLIGWVVAAAIYVSTTVWMFLTTGESEVRRHAAFEDENRGILTTVMLMAVAASLGVAVFALRDSKILGSRHPHFGQWIVLGLAGSTLILSWLIAQCLFVLHYAHRYFGDFEKNGKVDGGVAFPGEPPKTYRDFIYVAVCVGATCQVSDFNITTGRFRALVTTHALFSFAFNTMILALGINILAGLLGQ
jgi:uncharacterized membrane protein